MSNPRKAYPSDVSDDEWALVAPYLILLPETASQRTHALREVFNGLRYIVKTGAPWRWMPNDLPPGNRLSTGATMAASWLFRGTGRGPARHSAPCIRTGRAADRGYH